MDYCHTCLSELGPHNKAGNRICTFCNRNEMYEREFFKVQAIKRVIALGIAAAAIGAVVVVVVPALISNTLGG